MIADQYRVCTPCVLDACKNYICAEKAVVYHHACRLCPNVPLWHNIVLTHQAASRHILIFTPTSYPPCASSDPRANSTSHFCPNMLLPCKALSSRSHHTHVGQSWLPSITPRPRCVGRRRLTLCTAQDNHTPEQPPSDQPLVLADTAAHINASPVRPPWMQHLHHIPWLALGTALMVWCTRAVVRNPTHHSLAVASVSSHTIARPSIAPVGAVASSTSSSAVASPSLSLQDSVTYKFVRVCLYKCSCTAACMAMTHYNTHVHTPYTPTPHTHPHLIHTPTQMLSSRQTVGKLVAIAAVIVPVILLGSLILAQQNKQPLMPSLYEVYTVVANIPGVTVLVGGCVNGWVC